MTDNVMPPLLIGDLKASLPIVQGGMGVAISLAGLASAVANQGGIGVIATAGIGMNEPDLFQNFLEANKRALAREIQLARSMTKGLLGVNIMVALSNYADMVRTSIAEKIDVIFSGAGLPMKLPEFLTPDSKTKLVPIVSSARAAGILCKRWILHYNYPPDAVVVEGPKAGGHLGFRPEHIPDPAYALERLVPEIIAEVKTWEEKCGKRIPVIAGGGIYTGADIRKFLEMGAAGVQMATRFVTTTECDASMAFKQAYINAREEDMVIIKSPVGLPGRAIRNKFIDDVEKGEKKPFRCPYHCIITCNYKESPYCIALALLAAKRGTLDHGYAFAGHNAYRAEKIVSVKELVDTIRAEYEQSFRDHPARH